ncbi:hypothetical protein EU519_00265 [Candidatus Thorarchaeota archaeon]|nr:MAG: hypothetical protein EU519_00265 [Candidatus Thorarchaeota archaeon]
MANERTGFIYEFTYSSAPGLDEIFQCKYVTPDEALKRFKKILAMTESPFDFKIVISNEAIREESSFQVKGTVDEMLAKFRVFLETTTGQTLAPVVEDQPTLTFEKVSSESMSNFEKMQMIIYASFKHGKFSSLDVTEIYEATFGEDLPKSTASTYLARMWDKGKGHLERFGNRSGYTYRLKTELDEVQRETQRAEDILAAIEIQLD